MIDTDKYEEYQTARVEGFIPAEWEFEDYLLAEVKRLRERNDRLCEDLKRTRRWIQKQVQPLKTIAGQADNVACSAEKEMLEEYIGDD